MGNSGIILPANISKIVKERITLWKTLDSATHLVTEMEKQAGQVVAGQAATIPSQLTDSNTPPEEIVAAVRNFQTEASSIIKSQEQIKVHQAEIQRIQNQRMLLMVVGGIIALIILCAVGYGAISVLNSLFGG